MTNYPNRIHELRKKYHISQQRLSMEMNVSQQTVSIYERSTSIPTDALISASRFFNCSVDYLLGITELKNMSQPLSETEQSLIEFWRELPAEVRSDTFRLIRTISAGK